MPLHARLARKAGALTCLHIVVFLDAQETGLRSCNDVLSQCCLIRMTQQPPWLLPECGKPHASPQIYNCVVNCPWLFSRAVPVSFQSRHRRPRRQWTRPFADHDSTPIHLGCNPCGCFQPTLSQLIYRSIVAIVPPLTSPSSSLLMTRRSAGPMRRFLTGTLARNGHLEATLVLIPSSNSA